ncbi:ABC transporter permease [Serinicoccus kebangsaanensis]|uniref:ABC transporter permease n=1 Tax=Serinicoccus kebangsaanensis TaxID=2602069 RepID=UPI00192D5908|nr:ABC transporter permease [Serinicoccus kebangsaanensis]
MDHDGALGLTRRRRSVPIRTGGPGALVARRLVLLPVLAGVVTLVMFLLAQRSPFDPVLAVLGERALTLDGPTLEAMRARLEDTSAVQQWLTWWGNALTGDLGYSTSQRTSVGTVLAQRLPWTIGLVSASLLVSIPLGVALGGWAGTHPGSLVDRVIGPGMLSVQAAPPFWLGLVAVWVFAVTLGWLPTGGATSPQASGVELLDVLRHAVLPVLVLALAHLPWFVLVVRDATRDALAGAPVHAAWARGIPRRRLLRSHAVRPALLPLVTVLGVRVPELITGAVLVETVFSWPGIASATVDSALRLDFALLAALTVLTTVLVVLGNLAADLAYRLVDPRVGQRDG